MTGTSPTFEPILRLVEEFAGLALANRRDGAEFGIRRAMTRAGIASVSNFLERLSADEPTFDALIEEMTVGETYFFREAPQWEILKRRVLPEIRSRRGPNHPLRSWCAACASGEEAYSLAMVLDQEGLEFSSVLATDICRGALSRAKQGKYGNWSLRGDAAALAGPYLQTVGNQFEVAERLRRHVAFEYLNLARDTYPSLATGTWGQDLILCRNVLIYLNRQTIARVAQGLFNALAEGGWLVTAPSDPMLHPLAPFEIEMTEGGIFYRRPPLRSLEMPADETGRDTFRLSPEERSINESLSNEIGPQSSQSEGELLGQVRQAYQGGEYRQVVSLAEEIPDNLAAQILKVRALANLNTVEAARVGAQLVEHFPLSPEVNYLQAILFLALGREEEAIQGLKRVLYLDRSLALVQFTLAQVLSRRGDQAGARRCYRNARDFCRVRPPEEVLALGDGETCSQLAEAAAQHLSLLENGARNP